MHKIIFRDYKFRITELEGMGAENILFLFSLFKGMM